MKNRNVGFLICAISIVIGIIIIIFNQGLAKIVSQTCTHGPSCTMYDTINTQTWLSIAIAFLVFLIGIFFIFAKEPERIIIKKIKDKKKKLDLSGLDKDEKKVIDILIAENGAVFQSSLMEKMEIGKVKTTRMLDKLEAKQLIERKRRGMNNIIVLRN
ncbi:MAG: MarR family transcriptional regulator [Candidatus Pacearchaeota archaeon]|jgi:uncharacterized membrane protein